MYNLEGYRYRKSSIVYLTTNSLMMTLGLQLPIANSLVPQDRSDSVEDCNFNKSIIRRINNQFITECVALDFVVP